MRTKGFTTTIVTVCLAAVLVLAALTTTGGCTYVKPSDQVLIDDHLGNARAMADRADADPTLAPAYKQWIRADAESWQWLSDIAHRRRPTTQPAR